MENNFYAIGPSYLIEKVEKAHIPPHTRQAHVLLFVLVRSFDSSLKTRLSRCLLFFRDRLGIAAFDILMTRKKKNRDEKILSMLLMLQKGGRILKLFA
jgi:hypothetical protein